MAFEDVALNASADAIAVLANTGYLRLYDSNGGSLLVEFVLPNPAFGAAVGGIATANAVTPTVGLPAAGTGTTVTHYELYQSDGTTLLREGAVTHTSGGGDVKLDNTSVAESQNITITSMTITST